MELPGQGFIQAKHEVAAWCELELWEQDRWSIDIQSPAISYCTIKCQTICLKENYGSIKINPKVYNKNW